MDCFQRAVMKPQTYKNFDDLHRHMRSHSPQHAATREKPPSVFTSQTEGLSEDELFEHSMKGVNPRRWKSVPVRRHRPVETNNLSQQEESGLQEFFEFVQGRDSIDLQATGEYVEGAPHPKGKFLLHKLHRGHYTIDANLDLHGLNIRDARALFETFLKHCLRRSFGCIRIVHGRGHHSKDGQPVLKENLQRWLQSRRFSRHVVAYASAQLSDGGCGATYVLLKNFR